MEGNPITEADAPQMELQPRMPPSAGCKSEWGALGLSRGGSRRGFREAGSPILPQQKRDGISYSEGPAAAEEAVKCLFSGLSVQLFQVHK